MPANPMPAAEVDVSADRVGDELIARMPRRDFPGRVYLREALPLRLTGA